MNLLYGNSIEMMKKSLDYLWLKQGVISNNIANVDTVGYKAQSVTFQEEFKQRIDSAIGGGVEEIQNSFMSVTPSIYTSSSAGLRLDDNNVNAEVEMIELNKTYLQYQFAVESVTRDISRLQIAIKGQ